MEVCPGLISKPTAFRAYKKSLEQKISSYTSTGVEILIKLGVQATEIDKIGKIIGREFTFFKFLDFLVDIAEKAYSDETKLLAEKVCFMLEVMELSKGFR